MLKPAPCGPELSRESVLNAAQRWLSLRSPGVSLNDLPVRIVADACSYAVVIPNLTTEAREDTVIIIDRLGRVRNIPECCELGDCPELCAKPK